MTRDEKLNVLDMLEDIRQTCFDRQGEEINSDTITVIDDYIDNIENSLK